MAIKGKSKRGKRSRHRTPTKPPREVVARKPRDKGRRIPVNVFTVLFGLMAVTLVGIAIWAVFVYEPDGDGDGDGAGETEAALFDQSAPARREISEADAELQGYVQTVRDQGEVDAALDGTDALGARFAAQAQILDVVPTAGGTDEAFLGEVLAKGSTVLGEAARILSLARGADPELQAALAVKAERQRLLGEFLITTGESALRPDATLPAPDTVPDPGADPALVDNPTLGALPNVAVGPITVSTEPIDQVAWLAGAEATLTSFDEATASVAETVTAFQADPSDPAAFTAAAEQWATAARDAAAALAGLGTTEGLQAPALVLRTAFALYEEAARSFASAAVLPDRRDALLSNGVRLWAVAAALRTAASEEITRVTGSAIPAPVPPFPEALAPPATPAEQGIESE